MTKKVVSMGDHLEKIEPEGWNLQCHNCKETDCWVIYFKKRKGVYYVTGMACTSCETYLHVARGAIR